MTVANLGSKEVYFRIYRSLKKPFVIFRILFFKTWNDFCKTLFDTEASNLQVKFYSRVALVSIVGIFNIIAT